MVINFHRKQKKISNSIPYFVILVIVFLLMLSIGNAAYNQDLYINGNANFRIVTSIRIMDFKFISATNGGIEDYLPKFSSTGIITGITLPNPDSTVTYEISVTNFVNVALVLKEIIEENFNNDNIEYVLTGIDVNTIVPAFSTKNFQITFQYKPEVGTLSVNQSLGSRLDLSFVSAEPPKIVEKEDTKHIFYITKATDIDLASYVIATDVIDGDITDKVQISSIPEFDKNKVGTYKITYNVTNSAGEAATPLTIEIVIWNFVKIVNGQYHCIALGSNGCVWTWGYNSVGQRGLGNTTSAAGYRAPTQVPQSYFNNLPVTDIGAGFLSSFALNSAGQAYGWGEGIAYQLGNGSISNQSRPVAINQPSGITFTQISSFYQTGAALGDDGNIYTWGLNIYGSNGNGGSGNKAVPSAITSSGDFVQVSQGYYGGAAVNKSGQVYTWGTNLQGELGIGSTSGYNYLPTLVPSLTNVKEVSYGHQHVLALTNDGQVYAWGSNGSGRLGVGDTTTRSTPTLVSSLSNVKQINAAYDFSQFRVGNNIYSCGYAAFGELFAGNTTSRSSPTLSTMTNIADNVGCVAGRFDNAYILSTGGQMVYGIGFCDIVGQEFGSIVTQSSSTTSAVVWTFVTPEPE